MFLTSIGLRESAIDPSLFILQRSSIIGYLFVYVDDIVVIGVDDKEVDELVLKLSNEFPIRDLGQLKFFLGIQVTHVEDGIHLSQTQYLVNFLQSFDMEHLELAPTLMLLNLDLMS